MGIERKIDRDSTEPPYLQLVNILQDQIAEGLYLPGSRLPSESELCRHYNVSPMTVRRSIKSLLQRRIVDTIRGSGTYVKAPVLRAVTFSLEEFYQLFKDKEKTKVKILEVKIVKSDKNSSDKLMISLGEPAILIVRLILKDGEPIIYHRENLIYDPTRPIVEAELEVTSLHGLLVGGGETDLKRGQLSINAAVLSLEEADMLNTVKNSPAFRLDHLFYDFQDRPVSWGQFICRGDRIKFSAEIGITSIHNG